MLLFVVTLLVLASFHHDHKFLYRSSPQANKKYIMKQFVSAWWQPETGNTSSTDRSSLSFSLISEKRMYGDAGRHASCQLRHNNVVTAYCRPTQVINLIDRNNFSIYKTKIMYDDKCLPFWLSFLGQQRSTTHTRKINPMSRTARRFPNLAPGDVKRLQSSNKWETDSHSCSCDE